LTGSSGGDMGVGSILQGGATVVFSSVWPNDFFKGGQEWSGFILPTRN